MLKTYVIFILTLPFILCCPHEDKLLPCVCTLTGFYDSITCPGLENEQVLANIMQVVRPMKNLYSFKIENSTFRYLEHDIFKGVKFQEFEIKSSTFMALTDSDVAFEGLEEALTSIVITESNFLNAWEWSVLKNLKKLLKLHVSVNMDIISEDIKLINSPDLKDMSLADNLITDLPDNAFSSFPELLSLSLKNNLIREVKRSMFSNPAPLLWKLDLSHNELQQLPTDMFANMPSLETLNLDSNQLLTLNENTFNSIWEKLRHFYAMDNHLRCDCRLKWVTKLKFPATAKAVCDQPMQLRGKQLTELEDKDLWC